MRPRTVAKTTVVIATRNRAPELARTLTELCALRPRPAIVVLDNASVDNTVDEAEAFPDVKVIRLPRNPGAAARNLDVAIARTPYVAFSDDDSWWAGDALPEAERVLDSYPRLGLVAGRTLVGSDHRDDPVNELMATSPLGHPLSCRVRWFSASSPVRPSSGKRRTWRPPGSVRCCISVPKNGCCHSTWRPVAGTSVTWRTCAPTTTRRRGDDLRHGADESNSATTR